MQGTWATFKTSGPPSPHLSLANPNSFARQWLHALYMPVTVVVRMVGKVKMLRLGGCRPRFMSWREGTPGQMAEAAIQVTAGFPSTCQKVPEMAPDGSQRRTGEATKELPFQPEDRR